MNIDKLYQTKNVVYSFEIFPPKRTAEIDAVYSTLDGLSKLKPDYISVTYGAGGSKGENRTAEIAAIIKTKYHIEPLAHMTGINETEESASRLLKVLSDNHIENILALRGDKTENTQKNGCFEYASDLIRFIKKKYSFTLAGACYPEGHFECPRLVDDIKHLKIKADLGLSFLNSQLFFDNEEFYKFLDMAELAGIDIPIAAGIMPIVKKQHIERIVALSGAKIPAKMARMVARYENDPEALSEAGIAYATEQIADLITAGVRGIHLYVMNNVRMAEKLTANIQTLLTSANGVGR